MQPSDSILQTARGCLHTLELGDQSGWADVREAYRFLAKVWHPDRFAEGSTAQSRATERTKAINNSYEWLSQNQWLLPLSQFSSAGSPDPVEEPASSQGADTRATQPEGSGFEAQAPRNDSSSRPETRKGAARKKTGKGASSLVVAALFLLVSILAGVALIANSSWMGTVRTTSPIVPDTEADEPFDPVQLERAIVIYPYAPIRTYPSLNSEVVEEVDLDSTIWVEKGEGSWRQVRIGAYQGWVHVRHIRILAGQ